MATKRVDPTKPDETRHPLSVAQRNAVDLLAAGKSDQATAEAVGVSRQTVNGWKNHDPEFMAALNQRRADVWGESADRLRALLPQALDVLEGSLAVSRDPKVALAVLQLAGLGKVELALGRPGPTDPDGVLNAGVLQIHGESSLLALIDGPTEAQRRALRREWDELRALAETSE
jgi:hypothetical protein